MEEKNELKRKSKIGLGYVRVCECVQ